MKNLFQGSQAGGMLRWIPRTQFLNVQQLPTWSRKLIRPRYGKERPIRIAFLKTEEKFSLCLGERGSHQIDEFRKRGLMSRVVEWKQRHAGKLTRECVPLVLGRWVQEFDDWPSMTDEIQKQAGTHIVSQALGVKEEPHIKQVAGMLAVECRRNLSTEEFCV